MTPGESAKLLTEAADTRQLRLLQEFLTEPGYLEDDDSFASNVGQVRHHEESPRLGPQAGCRAVVVLPVQVNHGVADRDLTRNSVKFLACLSRKAV